jgi:SAM-dependent methyltransferase
METAMRRRFLEEYTRIRHAEGRGAEDAAYYCELPFRDLSGRLTWQWEMRARTYRHFERTVVKEAESRTWRPLDILDAGAGNGWMSYRLALRGHKPVALDILTDRKDGLGARRHYPAAFGAVEAEFDCLPFGEASFDLIVYNASLHYSTCYRSTLLAAKRCLRADGSIAILDSPVYRRCEHGERMVEERHAFFERRYGFRSDAVPSIEFLDEGTLAALARELRIEWRRFGPWYGWGWSVRPWKARILGRRPPSRFFILTGRFER